MQFHLDGFRPGDPAIAPAAARKDTPPDHVDVLIVGCGPAGLTLAAQLAAFPDIATMIVESKDGPLQLGQADGIACRTMEMFEAFGFSERVKKESYWVNEVAFWKPDAADPSRIVRSGRVQDVEDGLSEMPHVILNQARVHDFLLETMRHAPSRLEPVYRRRFIGFAMADSSATHPVAARLERLDAGHEGEIETVHARYVVGCDGARSSVRQAIGRALTGDSANQAWGVMDVLAVTDFPDVRLKAAIHSASDGSMLIIPREGGYLVRLYIELDKLAEGERVASKAITAEHLVKAAQRIFRPYTLDVREVAWWSVYEIGQRLCDRFDNASDNTTHPSVFIAGDACHTHSPKAGQGMNVSMQDGFNLGWKLAAVLRGQSSPAILHTYSDERRALAKELIDFDRAFAKMFSARPKESGAGDEDGIDPAEFQTYFVKQGRFTAGTAVHYAPSLITAAPVHQQLATGFTVGMRFHSAPAIRLADAKPLHLGHVAKADGRWRLFLFADDRMPDDPSSRLRALCEWLAQSDASPLRAYTSADADIDSVIDVRAVFQQSHRDLVFDALPPLLRPRKGRLELIDYEKAFCLDLKNGPDIFDARDIARASGCIVVVRPDQYVANVLPLDAHNDLAAFFGAFMLRPERG